MKELIAATVFLVPLLSGVLVYELIEDLLIAAPIAIVFGGLYGYIVGKYLNSAKEMTG